MVGATGRRDAAGFGRGFAFVGRRHELDLVLTAIRRPPAVVMVEGDAGMGKSRLVWEAVTVLGSQGWRVMTGFCHPLREPLPYGPVVDALDKIGPWLPDSGLPPTAGALAPLVPDLADRLPPAPVKPDSPGAARRQLIQAVRSVLASVGPVVMVIEDLHWVDDATRDLLLLLARDLPEQFALVVTYRAEDLAPGTHALGAAYRPPPGASGTVIQLSPLTETDVADLASAALGAQTTAELCVVLHRRSEGLPLVVEEDLITLRDQARRDVGELARAEVPDGLRDAVTDRLTALSAAGAAVVEAAAVLAVPATEALLAAVAGLDGEVCADGLVEALQAAVLRETETGRYAFRHVLAQQVAHRHIPGPRRTRLHQRAIDQLQAQDPVPLVQIAHHTLAAGDQRGWLDRTEQAAAQAVALGDPGTAATLLHQILNCPKAEGERRSRAALALARIVNFGVDYAATARALRAVLADPQLPPAARGEIRLGLGLVMLNIGRDPDGFRELEHAVDELATLPHKAAKAMIALALNDRGGAAAHAWHWLGRAEQAVQDSDDESSRMSVRATRLMLMAREGDPAVWPLAGQLSRRDDDGTTLNQTLFALGNLSGVAAQLGHDRRARDLLDEIESLVERTGRRPLQVVTRGRRLEIDWLAGHWTDVDEGYAALAQADPDNRLVGISRALYQGYLALAQGRCSRALKHFSTAAEHGGNTCSAYMNMEIIAARTVGDLAQGDPQSAWARAETGLSILRGLGSWARTGGLIPIAVEAAVACGHRAVAEQLVAEAESGLRGRDAPVALAELDLARGLLLRETEPMLAAEHFAEAQRRWQEIGRPYEVAKAAERRGDALACSSPEDAAAYLAEAARGFAEIGATGDAARCQHRLRELGAEALGRRGLRRGYGNELSPREIEVAELLAGGATNQDIAQTLFLSPRTVEKHVARVLTKLGTSRKDVHNALPVARDR
ncbi:MAG TPA: AAA family ATPase [Kutzneria sp.]|nr:AAA family ATPase [Kutzneria sp.]